MPCKLHSLVQESFAESGVKIYGGERAAHALSLTPADAPKKEYGSNELTLEIVSSFDEAVNHIHEYGSSHTEAIITGQSIPEWLVPVNVTCPIVCCQILPSSCCRNILARAKEYPVMGRGSFTLHTLFAALFILPVSEG